MVGAGAGGKGKYPHRSERTLEQCSVCGGVVVRCAWDITDQKRRYDLMATVDKGGTEGPLDSQESCMCAYAMASRSLSNRTFFKPVDSRPRFSHSALSSATFIFFASASVSVPSLAGASAVSSIASGAASGSASTSGSASGSVTFGGVGAFTGEAFFFGVVFFFGGETSGVGVGSGSGSGAGGGGGAATGTATGGAATGAARGGAGGGGTACAEAFTDGIIPALSCLSMRSTSSKVAAEEIAD